MPYIIRCNSLFSILILNNINNNSSMNKDNIPTGVVPKGIHHGLNTASTSKITNKFTLTTSNTNNEKGSKTWRYYDTPW